MQPFIRWLMVAAIFSAAPLAAQADLPGLLARAGQYVLTYEKHFSLLVAEEQYSQSVEDPPVISAGTNLGRDGSGGPRWGGNPTQRRALVSDFLLVALPGGGWFPFRDVFQVDGRPIQDRTDRLAKLFLTETGQARVDAAGAFEQAKRIMAESARYNIGTVQRNINLPTLALLFIAPENQPRFTYSEEASPAAGVRIVRYEEQQRPTLIRTTANRDLPARGRLWIAPDGRVTRTELIAADAQVRATITVTYEPAAALDMWMPVRMEEEHEVRGHPKIVKGMATYTKFRRFQVTTTEKIGG